MLHSQRIITDESVSLREFACIEAALLAKGGLLFADFLVKHGVGLRFYGGGVVDDFDGVGFEEFPAFDRVFTFFFCDRGCVEELKLWQLPDDKQTLPFRLRLRRPAQLAFTPRVPQNTQILQLRRVHLKQLNSLLDIVNEVLVQPEGFEVRHGGEGRQRGDGVVVHSQHLKGGVHIDALNVN